MTEDELVKHESEMVKRNAWCIVEDVVNKIHDEPGPGGSYMQAYKTNESGILDSTTESDYFCVCSEGK